MRRFLWIGTTLGLAPAVAAQAFVSPDWLADRATRPGLVILHIGMDRDRYDREHIPGSRFAPMMSFHGHGTALPPASDLASALGALGAGNGSRVVLVGDPMSAALLYVALDWLGHADSTSVLAGGITAWKVSGRPVTKDVPTFAAARFEPRIRGDLVVDAAWIEARSSAPAIKLLDARSASEYDGSSSEEGLPRSGHIPGAVHLDWVATFADPAAKPGGGNDAMLLPRDRLRQLFAGAGVAAGDTVVTYCTVGMRASHLYVVARSLGLPARIYPGSMADWTRESARPVVKGAHPDGA